ncbi:MAG: DUF1007 family protein [Desulfatitalea sp.]|nr:DUF1007 family protein [Desulfatitalea sp.]
MLPEAAAPIKRICWWLAFIIAIFAPLPWTAPTAWSHPHVFIEVRIEVELDARGIKGIWQHWTFDEYFSAWIIEEFDTDGDGKFSDEELPIVFEQSFHNLAKHGYYTKILVGDRQIPVNHIEHFSVAIENNHTIYSFFTSLNIAIEPDTPPVVVAVYDEDFYCHVFFPKGDTQFKGDVARWKIQHTTRQLPELAYYFGFMTPTAIQLTLTAP